MSGLHLWIAFAAAALLLAGCRGGGEAPQPEPEASGILAVRTTSELRGYGPPGTADPGTQAQMVYPYSGQGQVDYEGSFTITIPTPQQGWAYPMPTEVHVNLTRDGEVLPAKAPIVWLDSRITKPLFSTGAGPNDMVFGNDSLYIANSFDNTMVRYGLDGEVLGTIAYEENASPSYLVLQGNRLYVSANGENSLKCFEADTLHWASDPTVAATYGDEELAFLGPGQPVASDHYVWLPLASIVSFGPTVYEDNPSIQLLNLDLAGMPGGYGLEYGVNPQFGVYDFTRDWLLIVATGEIQFDEEWHPYATSSSHIEARSFSDQAVAAYPEYGSIELGAVGAGRITLDESAGVAFLGNSLNGNVYKVNTVTGEVLRGEGNPIVLTEEFTYISDVALTPDMRYVLATSFNTDELYVIDAQTDDVNPGPYPEPLDLSLDPELMAGAAKVEINPTPRADGGYDVYVLYGVANAVAKIELL